AARDGDTALLKDLYYQDDRRLDGAAVFVSEALRQPDARTASDKLALAARLLADGARETAGELAAVKEAAALLRAQEALGRDLAGAAGLVGLSVNETLFELVRLGYHGRAKKIQAEFRVPERVAWWVRLRALVAKRDWNEIEEMGKQRKSPIGWEPFYNLVLQAGNPRLASTFVAKCTNLEHGATVTMYEKCGMRVRAAEEAVRLRDADAWARLLDAAGKGTPEGREIEKLGQVVFKR
ncbi:Vacuolar protein sorting-associated protein, partial [Pleurostoma richardsiae]